MKHATMVAFWIAASLLGLGAVGAAVYENSHMWGGLYQNGKQVGTFNPGKHGGIEIHSTPDQLSNGFMELRRSDGGPSISVYVGKDK